MMPRHDFAAVTDDRSQGCSMPHCLNLADVFEDGAGYCFGCLERLIDRWLAIAYNPRMRERLPALWDR